MAEGDNSHLEEDDESDDHDEPVGSGDVLEDVQLILDFPGVDEVVDLEEHEEIENDGHVS